MHTRHLSQAGNQDIVCISNQRGKSADKKYLAQKNTLWPDSRKYLQKLGAALSEYQKTIQR